MIVDCFRLLDNQKLLEARLAILAPCVDKFLIFDSQPDHPETEFDDKIIRKPDFAYDDALAELGKLELEDTDIVIFSEMNNIPNLSRLNEISDILLGNYAISLISSVRSFTFDKKAFHQENMEAISNKSVASFYQSIKTYTLQKIWEGKDELFECHSPKGWFLNSESEYPKVKTASVKEIPEVLMNDMEKYKELLSGS